MDSLLCDELLIEIFQRLPPSTTSHHHHHLSLVSKRWLRLSRLSTTSLSLSLSFPSSSLLLSDYPYLSSLSLSYTHSNCSSSPPPFDRLLLSAAASIPARLHHLRLTDVGPISPSSLTSVSSSFTHLESLDVWLSRPLDFPAWLPTFPYLKALTLVISDAGDQTHQFNSTDTDGSELPTLLPLESLTLSGINSGDVGMGWLWRSCRAGGKLRRLKLSSCEGVGGDGASFSRCLGGVEEVELRACRATVDWVLHSLGENCSRLRSLVVYDGGSREGMLDFFMNCRCELERIDLRLPLDLDNRHLSAMGARFTGLKAVRLQSCFLFTGDGLRNLITAVGSVLEELSLINCDVVDKVPGLLMTLGQNLSQLKQLDLSRNETLSDKELISMLASCNSLVDLKLRGCKRLTRASVALLLRSCRQLESVDIMCCAGIDGEAVEQLVMNSPRLRRVDVEERKVSGVTRNSALSRWIEVVTS